MIDDSEKNVYAESIRSLLADLNNKSIYRYKKCRQIEGKKTKTELVYNLPWYSFLGLQADKIREYLEFNRKYLEGRVICPKLRDVLKLWLRGELLFFNTARLEADPVCLKTSKNHLLAAQQSINQYFQFQLDYAFTFGDFFISALTIKYSPEILIFMLSECGFSFDKAKDIIRSLESSTRSITHFIESQLKKPVPDNAEVTLYGFYKQHCKHFITLARKKERERERAKIKARRERLRLERERRREEKLLL